MDHGIELYTRAYLDGRRADAGRARRSRQLAAARRLSRRAELAATSARIAASRAS
jgi:hypothetical protein